MEQPIVGVVGASARAAAHSLARAGIAAWAVDLFADRDLHVPSARCPVADYPHALPALADPFPPGPVVYTGGLENHPAVVAALAARRPLWGNPHAVLEAVRDPFFPARVWSHPVDPVHCPRVLPADARPAGGSWLLKPRRGAGGDGIRVFDPAAPPRNPSAYYLQDFVPGKPMSAVFVGDGSDAQLMGVTEQLVGEPWLHAAPFHWAGNIGPIELPPEAADAVCAFGRAAARAGGLVGLFGVDFVSAGGVLVPVEVNPRYPASAEVIEHATGRPLMRAHAAACGAGPRPVPEPRDPGASPEGGSSTPSHPGRKGPGGSGRHVGKAVYYALRPITFPAAGPWDDVRPFDPWTIPAFADLPRPGDTIAPGWPVLTVFAAGSTPAEVRRRLQSRAADLDRLFAPGDTQ